MSPKRILVFCDGTGADANAITIPTGVAFPIGKWATNVVRLARSVRPISADGFQQIVFYQSGVGSVTDFEASTVTGTTWSQIRGVAVATKIREAYAYISQNYSSGDEICLFGFSRGAYTARKIAELIDVLGLLETSDLGYFFQYWSMLVKGEKLSKPGRDTKIKCVGVWDTVGAVSGVVDALHVKDDALPVSVITALHAVSLQDNRYSFWPTLWTVPSSGFAPGQTLTEVWFAGAHCDVGGGYENHELADLALFWMADQLTYPLTKQDIPRIVDLDLDFVWNCKGKTTDSWGNTQPNNAWKGTPAGVPKSRLDLFKSDFLLHESIKSAPTHLDSPFQMITLADLTKKFGEEWEPQCPALGPFETKCRNNWLLRNRVENDFENLGDLFLPVDWIRGDLVPVIPSAQLISAGLERVHYPQMDPIPLYVARVSYQNGICEISPALGQVWFPSDPSNSQYHSVTENYEVLNGLERNVRWVDVENEFQISKLKGAVPVVGGKDSKGHTLYVARDAPHSGWIRVGDAMVTYVLPYIHTTGGSSAYSVLVYNNLEAWFPSTSDFITAEDPGQKSQKAITITAMPCLPNVVAGITKFHFDPNLKIIAYADEISMNGFTAHINSFEDGNIRNGGASFLALASKDSGYQCGSWATPWYFTPSKCESQRPSIGKGIFSEKIYFNTPFQSQPKIFVGISGLDIVGSDQSIELSTKDVDMQGFKICVTNSSGADFRGVRVDWVAFVPREVNMLCDMVEYSPSLLKDFGHDGSLYVDFHGHFSNPPKIFTALTQYTSSDPYHSIFEANISNLTVSGMDVTFSGYATRAIVAYLAVDTAVAA